MVKTEISEVIDMVEGLRSLNAAWLLCEQAPRQFHETTIRSADETFGKVLEKLEGIRRSKNGENNR